MDIDLTKPLTDEAKAYLKDNLDKIEEAAGVIAFDPAQPLSRTAMEQLKITHKIAGKEETFTVYDAVQGKAKAGGADEMMKKASAALKVMEAADRIKSAQAAGKDAESEDVMLVASCLTADPQSLLAESEEGVDAVDSGGRGGQTNRKSKIENRNSEPPARKVTLADLDPELLKRLLPTEHHGAFLSEQLDAEATRILKESITTALANDPKRKAIEAKLGSDANKKAIMAAYDKIAIGTVDQQARGRIAELRGSGTSGDILGEIPAIAGRFVETMNPQTILDKAAPQTILLGGSSPDDAPLKVLSGEDLSAIPKFDSTWPEAMAKRAVQKLAAQEAGAA